MNEFKVGNKVKLKSLEEIRKIDKNLNFIEEVDLKKMQGKVYTISYICENPDCVLLEDVKNYWFKTDFLVKADIFFNITLPKDFTGKLTIEKGQIVEKEEEILNQEEREYLRAIVKPFRKKYHTYITKQKAYVGDDTERVHIYFETYTDINLPFFKKGTMYKGMELNKYYSLEELEL